MKRYARRYLSLHFIISDALFQSCAPFVAFRTRAITETICRAPFAAALFARKKKDGGRNLFPERPSRPCYVHSLVTLIVSRFPPLTRACASRFRALFQTANRTSQAPLSFNGAVRARVIWYRILTSSSLRRAVTTAGYASLSRKLHAEWWIGPRVNAKWRSRRLTAD